MIYPPTREPVPSFTTGNDEMTSRQLTSRSGITLMEVLIAMGILATGLASVVALIPAGGAAMKASIANDARAALGASAMADAITLGILAPSQWSPNPSGPPYNIIIDPLTATSFATTEFPIEPVDLARVPAGSSHAQYLFSGLDDLAYSTPDDDTTPPQPIPDPNVSDLIASTGAFSWLATLCAEPSTTNRYTLSVVTFFKRAYGDVLPNIPAIGSTAHDCFEFEANVLPAGEKITAWAPRGAAILLTDGTNCVWRTVVMASVDDEDNPSLCLLTFSRAAPFTPSFAYIFKGAVGVTERSVTLEENSSWGF